MDYVFIDGLKVNGRHGVADHERHVEQEFELWVKMWFDCQAAGKSDDLHLALNYVGIREMIIRTIQTESFYLIEKLGEVICENILADKRIATVELAIKKTGIWTDCVPGICIVREQE